MMIVNHGEEGHHECEDALGQWHGVGDHGDGDGDVSVIMVHLVILVVVIGFTLFYDHDYCHRY